MVKLPKEKISELDEIRTGMIKAGEFTPPYQFSQKDVETFSEKLKALPSAAIRRGSKSNELQGALVEASRKQSAQVSASTKVAEEIAKKMSPQDAADFTTVSTLSHDYQTEFDDLQLDGWGLNDNIKKAYKEYLKDSMKQYISANELYTDKLKKDGWGTNKNGDIVKESATTDLNTDKFSKISILDPESGRVLNYRNSSVDDIKKNYIDKGYKLYTMHQNEVESRGLTYTHYLSRDVDEVGKLGLFNLPYVKGGSVAYTPDTHYVKIGRDFYDIDGGKLFHGFVKTLKAGEDVKRLNKYAEEVNEVSEMWKRAQGDLATLQRDLDAANFQEFKVTSANDVQELMRTPENPKGLIDPNYKATVLRNDERYVYDDGGHGIEQLEEYDQSLSDLMQLRGMYYRSRGDRILSNINNDYSHVVDPFTMWQRNIEQAAYNNTLGRLLADWGDMFKEKYAPVIDTKGGKYNINRLSGQEVILSADIKAPNSAYEDMARAAQRAQMTYRNILNVPTKLDQHINNYISGLFKMLPKRWWDNKTMDALSRSDPIGWANAIIYRNYLGFFNPKQFLVQGPFQMLNTVAFEPLHGLHAAAAIPAVLAGHFFKNTPVFRVLPKIVAALEGISPQQFDKFLEFIEDYGTFKQFSKRPELTASMEGWLQRGSNIDLIFAQAGNNLAQLHADLTAFLKNGGKDMRTICRLSDDYMLNLNRVNTSAIQRSNIGKLTAQFTSYPLAAYEVMFGHHMTDMQRARFIAMQLGMWGIGGTFAKDLITNMYNIADENNIDPEEASYAMEGLAGHYFATLGLDVNEGTDFLGTFRQMAVLLMGVASAFGGQAPDLPISNVPTILIDRYKAVRSLLMPDTNTFDLLNWAKESSRMKGLASGPKNLLRALYARDARQFLDRHGNVIRQDPTQLQIWGQLLGFGPIEAKFDYRAMTKENMIRDAVREEFELKVAPAIREFVTFKDTGNGESELMQTRSSQWGYVVGNARSATAQFTMWLTTFHPEMLEYGRSLIRNGYEAGQPKDLQRSEPQKKYFKEQMETIQE